MKSTRSFIHFNTMDVSQIDMSFIRSIPEGYLTITDVNENTLLFAAYINPNVTKKII